MVATKEFLNGDVVLAEPPLLVMDTAPGTTTADRCACARLRVCACTDGVAVHGCVLEWEHLPCAHAVTEWARFGL